MSPKINRVVIGFSTSKNPWNPVAGVIRFGEGTSYSHVYVRFYSSSIERWLVYHATHTGLHFVGIDKFCETSKVIEEFGVDPTCGQYKSMLQYCVDSSGTKYGKLQIIGMSAVRLAKMWFNVDVSNPFSDGSKTQVCSELVGKLMDIMGIEVDKSKLEILGPRYLNGIMQDLVKAGVAKRLSE